MDRFDVSNSTGFSEIIKSRMLINLETNGYWLTHFKLESHRVAPSVETVLTSAAVLAGTSLGSRCSCAILRGEGDQNRLEAHTEGIYGKDGICPAFALGCVVAAQSGGQTRLLDARKAALIIKGRHPELGNTRIRYSSLAHPNEAAEYNLIDIDSVYGDVLRYRSKVVTNQPTYLPSGVTEDTFYHTVDAILEECIIFEHSWKEGDLLFVNNRITLHDRNKYTGKRVMVRVRYDEPAVTTFKY